MVLCCTFSVTCFYAWHVSLRSNHVDTCNCSFVFQGCMVFPCRHVPLFSQWYVANCQGDGFSEGCLPPLKGASDSRWEMGVQPQPKLLAPRPLRGFPALNRLTQIIHISGVMWRRSLQAQRRKRRVGGSRLQIEDSMDAIGWLQILHWGKTFSHKNKWLEM